MTVEQRDQFSINTGPTYIVPAYAPQVTLQYKTFIKRAMAEGLWNAFKIYEDETLKRAKIGPDYVTDRKDYPAVVIKWYEQSLENIGLGHKEFGSSQQIEELKAKVEITKGSAEVVGLASTNPLNPGETRIEGEGIPPETYVKNIVSETVIGISQPATETRQTEVTFIDIFNERFLEFHHSLYHGDVAFEIFGLSSLDRDKLADAIVEVIQMGKTGEEGSVFQTRVLESVGSGEFPFSAWHYLAMNTDQLQGYGEQEMIAPWMPEDTWVYKSEYRLKLLGEFYNIVPKQPAGRLEFIKEVDIYPYSTKDKFDTKPSEFPGGVIPKEKYLKITKKQKFTPYHTRPFTPTQQLFGKVSPKVTGERKAGLSFTRTANELTVTGGPSAGKHLW